MTFEYFKELVKADVKKNIIDAKKPDTTGSFGEILWRDVKTISKQSINIKMGNVLERSYKALKNNIILRAKTISTLIQRKVRQLRKRLTKYLDS